MKMIKKMMISFGSAALFLSSLAGCTYSSSHRESGQNTDKQIFNVSSSYFIHYSAEQTEDVYLVNGQVSQENDGNAVVLRLEAEEDTEINLKGTLEKVSGGDTELVYLSSDGKKTKIADNSSEIFETKISLTEGDGEIVFLGQHAVYDFELELELVDTVVYGKQPYKE